MSIPTSPSDPVTSGRLTKWSSYSIFAVFEAGLVAAMTEAPNVG